jgi:hypothetical protein
VELEASLLQGDRHVLQAWHIPMMWLLQSGHGLFDIVMPSTKTWLLSPLQAQMSPSQVRGFLLSIVSFMPLTERVPLPVDL